MFAGGVKLKKFSNKMKSFRVGNYFVINFIVEIAGYRHAALFAPPDFLPQTSFYIL